MKDIHKQFVFCGKNAKEWMRKCELLLPEIARREIWRKKNYGSIYEYAGKLAGMNREKVNECLRIYEHIEDKPELIEVAQEKGLLAVKPVATIATSEMASFWAEKANSMSKHALEKYVQEFRRPGTATQPAKVQISMELDPEIAQKLQKMKGTQDWNQFMEQLIQQEKPKSVKTESRHIPEKIKKYVLTKTGNKCACCNCKAIVLHHTKRFSQHHEHDPDHIIPLCKGHHQLAHLGYIMNEHDPPELWKFRDEPRPNAIDLKWQERARSG